ncbi:claudin-4-like [Genypterus blacodes]|uniref:claudin-4-like n=1 Tax=Genypterus blacodes TaxID=154954 RepID=UPI003F7606A7
MGHGRLIGGLALCILGVLGVSLACGLPMWRETSFVGANIVSAQSVWDGLWLHCVQQSTGQMQCKRQERSVSLTSDIQAGRALTLVSVVCGLLGFIVTLLGAGVVNCSGAQPEYDESSASSTHKKAALLGGALCLLSAILCLVAVSWSAANTMYTFNDPLLAPSLRREVGSCIYIGLVSALLLLLAGALICFVCKDKEPPPPARYPYMPQRPRTQFSDDPSRMATLRSDDRSFDSRLYDRRQTPPRMEPLDRMQGGFGPDPSFRSWTPEKSLFMPPQPNPVVTTPTPNQYYYIRP